MALAHGFFSPLYFFPPATWMNAERLQRCPYIPGLFQGRVGGGGGSGGGGGAVGVGAAWERISRFSSLVKPTWLKRSQSLLLRFVEKPPPSARRACSLPRGPERKRTATEERALPRKEAAAPPPLRPLPSLPPPPSSSRNLNLGVRYLVVESALSPVNEVNAQIDPEMFLCAAPPSAAPPFFSPRTDCARAAE